MKEFPEITTTYVLRLTPIYRHRLAEVLSAAAGVLFPLVRKLGLRSRPPPNTLFGSTALSFLSFL